MNTKLDGIISIIVQLVLMLMLQAVMDYYKVQNLYNTNNMFWCYIIVQQIWVYQIKV